MDNQQPSVIEWRTTIEYDRYEVSNDGRVRHKVRQKDLKGRPNPGGYLYVSFNINGKRQNFAIHRLVATAFIENPQNSPEVNHKNGDRADNRVSNLEWVTSRENKTHAYHKDSNRIERGKAVHQFTKDGEHLKTYSSLSEAAQAVGCKVGAISNCARGRSKTSMGYVWKYDEGSTTKYDRKS